MAEMAEKDTLIPVGRWITFGWYTQGLLETACDADNNEALTNVQALVEDC